MIYLHYRRFQVSENSFLYYFLFFLCHFNNLGRFFFFLSFSPHLLYFNFYRIKNLFFNYCDLVYQLLAEFVGGVSRSEYVYLRVRDQHESQHKIRARAGRQV